MSETTTAKVPGARCERVKDWPKAQRGEPGGFCGTVAHWRYPDASGGFMYLCDEHAITHLDYVEAVDASH